MEKVQHMGGNQDNMRQAMKELLGLVGFGPEEDTGARGAAAEPADRTEPASRPVERPVEKKPTERPVTAERPVERKSEPAPERPAEPKATVRPAAETVITEEPKRKSAAPVVRTGGFFSFGEKKEKEPVFGARVEKEPVYTAPVEESYEEPQRPPFIRPGATVIAAGATFFGDIRAEGDVEVLGKLKGNLEATGNVRVVGKVLGDVKGEAVILDGCTVQGNITSTSFVALDEGAMVVGDVLATDLRCDGKVKGNLQIARAANFSSCALLAGNVIAATIMMAQGARVQGAVRIAEDPETNSLFGDLEI